MFRNYLKTAYRNLLKNKIHTLINLAGLSIGIACTIVISIFISYESGFDAFHQKAPNTFRVVQHTQFSEGMLYWGTTCYPIAEALRNDFGDFASVTQAAGPMNRFFAVDRGNGEVVRFQEPYVLYVDTAYARVFDFQWLAGNPREAFALKNSIVLTEKTAKKSFGKIELKDYASILGKTILLNGKDPLTVTGVIEDAPGNVSLQYSILVPYEFFKENNPYSARNWAGNYRGTTFVVLKNNGDEAAIEQKINSWKKKYLRPEDDVRISYFLQPVNEVHNDTTYETTPESYAMPFSILRSAALVGIFILVIAAVNFINLTTARAVTRAKEVGIRKVMGSSRLRLVTQFVYEHSLLIVVTLLISVGLSQFAIDQLNNYLTAINLKLTFSWDDASMVLLIGCAVILIAAIYPALVLSSFKPVDAVKNKIDGGRQRFFTLRRALIVMQFTVVQLLIIATIIVARQVHHFNNTDLGFTSKSILAMPAPMRESNEAFRTRLLEHPYITDVTFGSSAPIPVDMSYGTSYWLPQQSEVEGKEAEMKVVDPGYISFFNLQLVSGRNFSDVREPFDEFIVNEKLAKSMGWTPEQALGRRLRINEGEATIVGVVKDFQNTSLRSDLTPCVLMNGAWLLDRAYVRIGNPMSGMTADIEKTWKEFAPEKVFSHTILTEAIEKQYGVETMVFHGFTAFSLIAIFIGCLGLFGLSSFMAIRRAKEIGIRKVLGASITNIVGQFSKEFMWMVVIGFLFASPLAWVLMEQWLQEFANRIQMGWWMFAAGGAIALVIALATVSFHSIQVGTSNPVDSLRNE